MKQWIVRVYVKPEGMLWLDLKFVQEAMPNLQQLQSIWKLDDVIIGPHGAVPYDSMLCAMLATMEQVEQSEKPKGSLFTLVDPNNKGPAA